MADGLVHTRSQDTLAPADYGSGDSRAGAMPEQGPLDRPLAAVRRYKWLIAAVTVLATGLGLVATRFISPQYEVRATLWVASAPARPGAERSGPIRSAELLNNQAWIELFRSYRVVDEVVRKLGMFVMPEDPADKPLFDGFSLAERFAPGVYVLTIDSAAAAWTLATDDGIPVERGAVSDSVGRKVGMRWVLPPTASATARSVRFIVIPPRDKSLELLSRVGHRMQLGSNFLWLTFPDADAKRAQLTLNTWVDEYVRVAADLKKQSVVEFSKILEGQLRVAEKATQDAEAAYESFRVNTIILPTEGGPVAARGVENERDPAIASFFDQKIEYDNLRNDREALEQTMINAAAGKSPYEGLLFIPSVAQSPGAEALREAFRSQYAMQADLRVKQQTFTAQHPAVMEVSNALEMLKKQTIPHLATELLAQLRERERDYERRIQNATRELREIPPRTIEERRLARAVSVSEALYTNLKGRYAEAQLAEAGATPDVSVLDTAIAPLSPSKNTAIMVVLLGIFGGLGGAVALALLLDQMDRRFRYPHQATNELGLVVAGAVPRVPKGGVDARSPEQVVQFHEAFRTLRMHVMHSGPGERPTLAVTSAAPGDGKSLISANLALSFADAGLKTAIVDGDTRRGALHRLYGLKASFGLTEYLAGAFEIDQVLRPTNHENLSIITCGARHPRSPEMLATPRLKQLVEALSQRFDIVIIDTPPLAAGIDGYALSAAAGRVLMVLRMGQTERRLVAAKLATLDRLPVDIVGAVLNEVPGSGEFQYYSYAAGYSVDAGAPAGELVGTVDR